ncbi:MAG: CYTH domain-containing protein [Aphanocapsa lilacina HA4352-LM1]|jgi:adenylate cyclase class 2|nr:CYTH domain-containing protein [Aphanocapsa lilacina HA4352-LM1]
MFEVEKKYRLPRAQRDALQHKLTECYGPPRVLREEDVHGFTSPEKHYLRLRASGDSLKLIAKGPTQLSADGIRSRREIEVPLSPQVLDAARSLVQLIATDALPAMRRTRSVWKLGEDAEVVLDDLDALPEEPFVELEILASDQAAALSRLRTWEERLGLDPTWQEVKSYAQILSELISPPPETG